MQTRAHAVARHRRNQRACRFGQQADLAEAHAGAQRADDSITAVQGAPEGDLIAGIALDQFCSRQIDACRRANQRHDGMAFRHGLADDQPSRSARCTQNENLHV
jgi:hypothetical protein